MKNLIKTCLNWIAAKRWRKSLSHCVEGLAVFLPVGVLGGNWPFAAWAVVIWYYSRKVTETQLDLKHQQAASSTVAVWDQGLFPWDWWAFDPYRVLDVVAPAVSSFMLAYAISAHPAQSILNFLS